MMFHARDVLLVIPVQSTYPSEQLQGRCRNLCLLLPYAPACAWLLEGGCMSSNGTHSSCIVQLP